MTPHAEDYNEDELQAPEWLNFDFFAQVLQKAEQSNDIEVKDLKISPATVKGDHYASVMFRTLVSFTNKGERKERSLIIKTLPEADCTKKDLLGDSQIFETEIGMYTEVLPRFERILREIGDETVLEAPCIWHSVEPKKVMVFEDLVVHGYTAIRKRLMTYEEAKCAYTKLAKWHAVSFKILKEDPVYFKEYRHGIFSMEQWRTNPMFLNGAKFFTEFLKAEPSLAKYVKYFENSYESISEKGMDSFNAYINDEDLVYVLCHGDFHMKNVMVKYSDEGSKFEDLMLLDFQMSYVGPWHNDLAYGLFMMLGEDNRLDKMDEVIYDYHQTFTQTLKKIGFTDEIPSLVQLRQQMMREKHLELFLMMTFLPLWITFRNGDADVDRLMADHEYHKEMFKNPDYIQEVQRLLSSYLLRGYLEDLL